MKISNLTIKNKKIELVLHQAQRMFFGNKNRIRGFVENEYEIVKNYSTSESYLKKRLNEKRATIEFAYNMIIGESEGGKHVLNELRPILKFTSYYTAGYYPYGFVGWHDDVDIYGYYIMLTYCTESTGFFRYADPKSKEIITDYDRPGWIAKGVHLGTTEADILWHCAVTYSPRYTFLLHYDIADSYEEAKEILIHE